MGSWLVPTSRPSPPVGASRATVPERRRWDLSGNEDRSGRRGPGALRRYLTGGGRVRSVITLVVVGCAAALLLTAVTGAFATKNPDTKTNPRCIAGGCPEPNPFGYPLGAKTSRRQFWLCPRPRRRGKRSFTPTGPLRGRQMSTRRAGAVFGEGSDIFAALNRVGPRIVKLAPRSPAVDRPPSGGDVSVRAPGRQ